MGKPGFNLCQPGSTSCGACCGLYHFRHHSRAQLLERLERRTARFSSLEKSRELWSGAARQLRSDERGGKPAALSEPELPCPLLGFLDAQQTRIGCLGHPLVTRGVDLRDCGNYNAQVCTEFLCDSFEQLPAEAAELVRRCCTDWYLYGLVISDPPFVLACATLVAGASGPAELRRLLDRPAALQAFGALLALKQEGVERESSPQVLGRAPELGSLDPEARVLALLGCRPGDEAATAELRRRVATARAALEARE